MNMCRHIPWILASLLLSAWLSPAAAGPQTKLHTTSTAISCTPDPVVLDGVTTCTATVTDLGGQGPIVPPDGSVSFGTDSSGNFSFASCTLVTINASQSACSVTYSPTAIDSGTHTISGTYSGGFDPNTSTGIQWLGSNGSTGLTISYPSLTIVSVSPAIGLRGETTSVTVTGSGFVAGGTTLDFGTNITQSNFTVVDANTITVDLAIGVNATTGARNVTATNPAPGGGSATLVNGFSVQNPLPDLVALSPAAAEQNSGALVVTITGTGFLPDSTAYFNGAARGTSFVSSTELQVSLPAGDITTVGSFPITVANGTPGGGTSNSLDFTVAASGGSFDVVESGGSLSAGIYLKLVGTSFTLDLLATDLSRTSIDTGFTGNVKLELLDASDDTGSLDANGCRSSWTVAASLPDMNFAASDNGRKSFTTSHAQALRSARFRMTYPASGTTEKIGCSSDAFTIRPLALTASSSLNNGATSGAPTASAGDSFDIVVGSVAGYDGTPQLDASLLEAHAGAVAPGSLSGSFPAANPLSGQSTGSFTYSEVGSFRFGAGGVYDDNFSAVDQSGDCTNDFSNVAVGGQYGCRLGNATDTQWFGRFRPDHFDVTLTDACTDAGGFSYSGQPFANLTITARNATGGVTQNYDYSSGDAIDANNHSNDVTLSFGGSSTEFSPAAISFMDFSSGVYSGDDAVAYRFASAETGFTDIAPRATDSEGTTSAGFTEDSSEIRSARVAVSNVTAITTGDANVGFLLQAWQDDGLGGEDWLEHTDDSSCTDFVQADFSLDNFTGSLDSGETSISAFIYTSPSGMLTLSAPGSGNAGSVDVILDASTRPWLRFDADSDGTLDDPTGTTSFFDIFETEDGFINRQEIVR